jgi:HK97 family phage portal protein
VAVDAGAHPRWTSWPVMRWFFEQPAEQHEQRATGMAPIPPLVYPSATFADISLASAESSLQSVAVRAAVDLIASLGSELPMDVYSGVGRDRQTRTMPGYLQDPAGDGHGLEDWCYQVLESWLLRGNVYGDIVDVAPRVGYPTQVVLQHPDEVHGWLDSDGVVHWLIAGREVDAAKLLHRRVNPVPGRVQGLSPVAYHAAQIGLSLTSTQFGLQWFRDGGHPSGMLTNSELQLDDKQIAAAKAKFLAAVYGSREPMVMGKGWTYEGIQINPEESQFLETQGFSAAECARIFGPGIAEVLGYESGGSLTYGNVVDRDLHLLKYSLNKWLRRLERLLTSMLPRPQYLRIDRDAMLQTATLDRYRAHESALRNRWKVVNEVRDDEDLQPVAWGDEPNPPVAPGAAAPEEDTPPAKAPKDGKKP